MGGDLPTRADLDAISKTQPIIVWDASEHYVFANSAAIQKYGITDDLVAKTIGAGKNPDGSLERPVSRHRSRQDHRPQAAVGNPDAGGRPQAPALSRRADAAGRHHRDRRPVLWRRQSRSSRTMLTQRIFRTAEFHRPHRACRRRRHLPGLYGDSAIDEATEAARHQQRAHHLQRREILCRRRLRLARHGAAISGLHQRRPVQGPVHVQLQGRVPERDAAVVECRLPDSRAFERLGRQPDHARRAGRAAGGDAALRSPLLVRAFRHFEHRPGPSGQGARRAGLDQSLLRRRSAPT